MASWILVLISLYGVLHVEAGNKVTSVECCRRGRERGEWRGECLALPIISSNLHCTMVQEKCCEATLIHKLCDKGIMMYREQGSCEKPFFRGNNWKKDKDTIKMCCDCCMLGSEEAKHNSNCELTGLMLSRQCREAARTCCRNATNKETDPEHKAPVTEKPEVTTTTRPQGRNETCGDSICAHLCVGNGTCACNDGYRLQKDGVSCEDINECLNGSHNCATGHMCINTQGSFFCRREKSCGAGYELQDNSCKDINECTLGTHNCEADFVCNNTPGSFRCNPRVKCRGGFIPDAFGSCIDINECVTHINPCPPSQTCSNTDGSYTCSRNTLNCRRGFHLTDNGTRCEDIDECALQTDNRLCPYHCSNTDGSFICTCPPMGYTLSDDGQMCQDIDECSARTHDCADDRSCFNIQGGFRCLSYKCPPNYREIEVGEGLALSLRCSRICPTNSLLCPGFPDQIISHINIALPTFMSLSGPEELVFLRTNVQADPGPNAAEVNFRIHVVKQIQFQFYFDVQMRSFGGYIMGVVRQLNPIHGPRDIDLDVDIRYMKGDSFTHSSKVYIHVIISEFSF